MIPCAEICSIVTKLIDLEIETQPALGVVQGVERVPVGHVRPSALSLHHPSGHRRGTVYIVNDQLRTLLLA